MLNYKWGIAGILLFLVHGLSVTAQVDIPELVTDRPDQTESATTVPNNSLQIETGYVFQSDEIVNGSLHSTAYNTTLLRFGLLENTEIRLGFEYLGEKFIPDQGDQITQVGFSPLYAGFKIRFAEEQGWLPEMAFLPSISMPFTADEYYRIDYVSPSMRLAFSHTLSSNSGIGYNLAIEWDGKQLEPVYKYTVAYGFGLTPALGMFIEAYGGWGENYPFDLRADTGFTLLLMSNLQFDLAGGVGITDSSPDYFVGFGFSFRIPH